MTGVHGVEKPFVGMKRGARDWGNGAHENWHEGSSGTRGKENPRVLKILNFRALAGFFIGPL
ncbi:hypothetical protein ES332_A06G044100v1 [Gossypium tomentosum]|uniref:Uncharacterized protein n=1 Tax=Gossypium tomentosum TaxID=34277 RepID=A0A5D2PZF0_GOSTO|nr:hypothetical protein ES332_A06G044100v1 [Gossypium tomentosum]